MSSLNPINRSASANKNDRSVSPKSNKINKNDRSSLCSFTFADGRRCRAPRFGNHPRFCPDHARKVDRVRARENLAKDLAYFFSGDYLSACDLTVALGRLIPAIIRGDVKGKAARTVAYLAQTLLQSIHVSQHEYTNSFGSDAWRKSIRNSVHENHDYRFPPTPTPPSDRPQPPAEPQPNCHSERSRPIFSAVFAPAKTSACAVVESASAFSSPSGLQSPEPLPDQAVVAGLRTGAVQPPPVPASNVPP